MLPHLVRAVKGIQGALKQSDLKSSRAEDNAQPRHQRCVALRHHAICTDPGHPKWSRAAEAVANKVKPGTQTSGRMFFPRLSQRKTRHPCTCLLAYAVPGSLQCSGDDRTRDHSRSHHPIPCAARSCSAPLSLVCRPASLPPPPSTPQEDGGPVLFSALVPCQRPLTRGPGVGPLTPITRPSQTSPEGDRGPAPFNHQSSNVLASTIPMRGLSALVPCRRWVTSGPAARPLQYPATGTGLRPPVLPAWTCSLPPSPSTRQEDGGRSSAVLWCFVGDP